MTWQPRRRSIRLRGYDYTRAGAYFVTVCAQGRQCLFGSIGDEESNLNDAGRMIERWWAELPSKYPSVETDEYIVMPNHFHGIVLLGGTTQQDEPAEVSLSRVVQWFKTMTTNAYIQGVKYTGWAPFPGRLWQRNYYERIIRDEPELGQIRRYIADNPARWASDEENPAVSGTPRDTLGALHL